MKRSKALRCFVPIFSSKQYVKALQVRERLVLTPGGKQASSKASMHACMHVCLSCSSAQLAPPSLMFLLCNA